MTSIRRVGYLGRALHAVGRRWVLVLCTALAVAALAVALDALRGFRYTAESLVRVQSLQNPGEAESEDISQGRLAEVRAAAGAEEVAREAMSELGWQGDIREFERRLEVEAGEEGTLGVAFSAADPERAVEGANAYARSFVARVEQLEEDRLAGGALNASAEVVREAQSPPARRPLAVGLVALAPGLAAGGALALALGERGRRWRNTRDAELTLGAPVLGVIPEYGSGESESGERDVDRGG